MLCSNYDKAFWTFSTLIFLCSDDKHSDREPKRRRHDRVFLHAVNGCRRGGRHSFVTQQRLWPVRLSHVVDKTPTVVFPNDINLQHFSDSVGSLRSCRPLRLVLQQCKNCVSCLITCQNIIASQYSSLTFFLLFWSPTLEVTELNSADFAKLYHQCYVYVANFPSYVPLYLYVCWYGLRLSDLNKETTYLLT